MNAITRQDALASNSLAHFDQLAQAAPSIGTVTAVKGQVTVVHADGSQDTLTPGAMVYQNDTLQTGPDGSVGLTFTDGTQFSLGSAGRMVLDEMVYDPASSGGSATMTVLTGAFTFVSGAVAKSAPDAMQIKTPVATIGIRGTSGSGQVDGDILTVVLIPDPSGLVGEIIVITPGGQTFTLNMPLGAFTVTDGVPRTYTMSLSEFNASFGHGLDILPQGQELRDRLDAVPDTGSNPGTDGTQDTAAAAADDQEVNSASSETESTAPEDLASSTVGKGTADGDGVSTPDGTTTDGTTATEDTAAATAEATGDTFATEVTTVTTTTSSSAPPETAATETGTTETAPSTTTTTSPPSSSTPPPVITSMAATVIGATIFDQSLSTLHWTVTGDDAKNTILTGSGNDAVDPRGGSDTVTTGDGNDTLKDGDTAATAGNDILQGGLGNDTYILSGYGNDTILDTGGSDTLNVAAFTGQDDLSVERSGVDLVIKRDDGTTMLTVTNAYTTGTLETIVDDEGTRLFVTSLTGTAAAELIVGDGGNNVINGNGGLDIIFGGGGNDTITGGTVKDDLWGGTGNDTLYGLGGDDTLNGGAGTDTLVGGSGNDNYDYSSTLWTASGFGADTINDTSGTSDHLFMEGIGAASWMTRTGNDLVMTFDGGGGTSTITITNHYTTGTVESITLNGTSGDAGGGDFYLLATGGASGSQGSIFAASTTAPTVVGGSGNDIIYLLDNITSSATGGDGDDIFITGTSTYAYAPSVINGGNGNDTLYFNSNPMVLLGSTVTGIEKFSFATNIGATVNWDAATSLTKLSGPGGAGGEGLLEFVNSTSSTSIDIHAVAFDSYSSGVKIVGASQNEFISGTSHDDTILGNAGNDTIYGNGGSDTISGGTGLDIFAWSVAPKTGEVDTITDFSAADDTLQFTATAFNLAAGRIFVDVDGTLDAAYGASTGGGIVAIANGANCDVWYYTDITNTAAASYQIATLTGVSTTSLNASTDFTVV